MSDLLIIGAGGHGKVVAETAEAMGGWTSIRFLDDDFLKLSGTLRWPVVSLEVAAGLSKDDTAVVVAIGHSAKRMGLLDEFRADGFTIPVLIHPSAWVSPSASMGEGTVVFAGAMIQADSRLGRGVIVNTLASVDHDCRLGDGVHVCPGTHLAGEVRVGGGSWIGIGTSVIQQVTIGERVTVGAGSAVIGDIADDKTVAGCPARELNRQA